MKKGTAIERAMVLTLLRAGRIREGALRDMLGDKFDAVMADLHQRVLAKRVKIPHEAGLSWVECEPIMARCPWTREQVLAQLETKPCTTSELATVAKCQMEAMRLLLRRMQYDKQIKIKSIKGAGHRRWIPYTQYVVNGGERRPVTPEELLALIAEHQPARVETLMELTGRGRMYLRGEIGKLHRAGKLGIVTVDRGWLYVIPGYVPPPEHIGREILLRCKDVGGDCLVWSGAARDPQGHPLIRYRGRNQRVDKLLWTEVHGKTIKPGHVLVGTCETLGCCQHEHHKQVTRSKAMQIAFAKLGIGGDSHGRRVAAAVRHKIGTLTPEDVRVIRESPLSAPKLSRERGWSKSVINDVRAGHTYKDYTPPRTALGQLVEAVCR